MMFLKLDYVFAPLSLSTKAVAQRCFVKKVFLEISQNLQESTCTRVSFLNDSGAGLFL